MCSRGSDPEIFSFTLHAAYGSMLTLSRFRVDKEQTLAGNRKLRSHTCIISAGLFGFPTGSGDFEITGFSGNSMVGINRHSGYLLEFFGSSAILVRANRTVAPGVLNMCRLQRCGDFFCAE